MIAIEEKKLKNQIFFLNSIRIAIHCAIILIIGIVYLFFHILISINPLLFSLLGAILITLGYFPLIHIMRPRPLIFMQLSIDILVITVLVYFSGGIVSPFYFLYILPILVSAFFLSRRETFYVAFLCFILFGVLSNLLYIGIIPFFSGLEIDSVPLSNYIYNLLMSFMAFSFVAILSSHYFKRIRETGEKLKIVQENLQDMILLNNSVLEKMDNCFITSDIDGHVLSYNERASTLLGINSSRNIFDLLFARAEKEAISVIDSSDNHFYIEKKFSNFDLGISVSVLDRISGFDRILVFLISDLTERKKIEMKLKEKENLAMIGQMLSGIAHEIRNPLASISGSVQFMKNEFDLSPEYQNLMNIIIRESDRLSRSINSILDFSRQSPPRLERFDLSVLVDEIVAMVVINYQKIRFIKRYSAGNAIDADFEKIKQVVWNIINNSIKAISESGSIELTIFRKDGSVHLSVKDDGIGMDDSELASVFSLFYSRFTAGVGLGMHVVKRILDEHGFTIDIKSEKNRGTEVIICFKKTSKS